MLKKLSKGVGPAPRQKQYILKIKKGLLYQWGSTSGQLLKFHWEKKGPGTLMGGPTGFATRTKLTKKKWQMTYRGKQKHSNLHLQVTFESELL